MTISKKTNPHLWEVAKAKACSEGGLCKHSARKMQWSTRYYKRHGGKYVGPILPENSLAIWGRQKWRTVDGKKSEGKRRYLPSKAWENLSPSEKKRTNAAKLKGYHQGRQYVRQPNDIARKTRRFRSAPRKTKTATLRRPPTRKKKTGQRPTGKKKTGPERRRRRT